VADKKDDVRPLISLNVLCFLQCVDTDGSVTQRTSGPFTNPQTFFSGTGRMTQWELADSASR